MATAVTGFVTPIPDAPSNRFAYVIPDVDLTKGVLVGSNYQLTLQIGFDFITEPMKTIKGLYVYNPSSYPITITIEGTNQVVDVAANAIIYVQVFSSFPVNVLFSVSKNVDNTPTVIFTNYEFPNIVGINYQIGKSA